MDDSFTKTVKKHAEHAPTEADQKALEAPRNTKMGDEQNRFLQTVLALIDAGTIDTKVPSTFINDDIYAGLDPKWRAKTDQALPNIASLLDRIIDLHARPEQDASFEMQNLIDSLWQAKERIEQHADVFIF